MKNKKIRAMFCPSCKSFDVKYIHSFGNIFGIIPKQKCFSCNYTAMTFPILETTSESLNKKKGSNKKR